MTVTCSPHDLDEPPPWEGSVETAALMLTRRCNMTCEHCSVASGPGIKDELSEEEVERRVEGMIAAGIRGVLLTGGEPMLREALVLRLTERLRSHGVTVAMTSNGYWGQTAPEAFRVVRLLRKAGLSLLTISYDRFHAEFMGFDPVRHIAAACSEAALPMNLNITRTAEDGELETFHREHLSLPNVRFRFYDVQPVGRAKHLDPSQLRTSQDGFCNACRSPAILDNGRVTACNGPSYFQKLGSPLRVGEASEPLTVVLKKHAEDPYLEGIRMLGPARMLRELLALPEQTGFVPKSAYTGMCDICLHLASAPLAVEALRQRLSQDDLAAEMTAVRKVLFSRQNETQNLQRLNAVLAPRFFLFGALDGSTRLPDHAANVIGRADLDWSSLATRLLRAGLARPLLTLLDDPLLCQYAPRFFRKSLQNAAEIGTARLLMAREALHKINGVLGEIGVRAVLLKSPSISLFQTAESVSPPPGDIDLLILDGRAPEVSARLRALGAVSGMEPGRVNGPTPHHLEPLVLNGLLVELHETVARPWTGLPEKEMLDGIEPILDNVFRMRPEAVLLHVAAHCGWHDFDPGLKTAWTVGRILKSFPLFDWDHLARLVGAFSGSRGFWAIIGILKQDFGFPVPEGFVALRPVDRVQKRVDRVARYHFLGLGGQKNGKEYFLQPSLILLSQRTGEGVVRAFGEFVRVFFKELNFRLRVSRASIGTDATYMDLIRRELREYGRTYRQIISG